MALAEKILAARFNRKGFPVVDHFTYVFLGDGCMMEGISHEACSLAGTLGLGKLIALYDDNGISIDGRVEGWFTDDTPGRFKAYGWHVVPDVDGHDSVAVAKALVAARKETTRPSLVRCKTCIGQGAPTAGGSEKCHGAPLGPEEIARAREHLNWPHPPFVIPGDIAADWDARGRGRATQAAWDELVALYARNHPEPAKEFQRLVQGRLPENLETMAEEYIESVHRAGENLATRKASQQAIEGLAPRLPELVGGSADLASSNLTRWSGSTSVTRHNAHGNYIHFGVREFGMAAIMNGMALHGGLIPYGGTFLVFSDYARNALRMAALMGLRVIHVLTHDSIGVGEDGPTHQPVEHTASLRLIPNLRVWRPCDAVETAVAWAEAVKREQGPSALILSRQTLPHQQRSPETLKSIARGGYVLWEPGQPPRALILASGSEVFLAVEAAAMLEKRGLHARVVSMPCLEAFDGQDPLYRSEVLPPGISARVAVEAGSPESWHRHVGREGIVLSMNGFGESAPGNTLFKHFGFTAHAVAQAVQSLMEALWRAA